MIRSLLGDLFQLRRAPRYLAQPGDARGLGRCENAGIDAAENDDQRAERLGAGPGRRNKSAPRHVFLNIAGDSGVKLSDRCTR